MPCECFADDRQAAHIKLGKGAAVLSPYAVTENARPAKILHERATGSIDGCAIFGACGSAQELVRPRTHVQRKFSMCRVEERSIKVRERLHSIALEHRALFGDECPVGALEVLGLHARGLRL